MSVFPGRSESLEFLRKSNDSERPGKTDMRGQRRRRGCTSHSAPPPIPPVHVGSSYRDRGYVGVGRNLWVGADGRAGGRTGGRAGGAELRRRGGRPAGRLAAPNRFMPEGIFYVRKYINVFPDIEMFLSDIKCIFRTWFLSWPARRPSGGRPAARPSVRPSVRPPRPMISARHRRTRGRGISCQHGCAEWAGRRGGMDTLSALADRTCMFSLTAQNH